jgi:putative ABC transport system permease protein
MLSRLIARIRGIVTRQTVASELEQELQFHLTQEIEANIARGLSPETARRAAFRDLGGFEQTREAVGDVRALWLDGLWRDARHAIRALRAAPAFTAVALAVLALCVGATVAVFSVVDAVIFRSLPFDEPHRLVAVGEEHRPSPEWPNLVAPQNFFDWRERQDVFTGLAAAAYGQISVKAAGDDFPENLPARLVTANYFEVLRTPPLIGRPFTTENEVAGRGHVAVISYRLWQRRFGGRPDVLGQRLPGQLAAFEIVGVMPNTFNDPVDSAEPIEVWVPFVAPPDARIRGNDFGYYLQVIGRLRDGVSIERAQARMDRITADLAAETPRWFTDRVAKVEFLQDFITRRVRAWMLMLLGAIGCVLLIACVNLANLMLARGTTRTRELEVRAALGASRAQLARVLLVESLLLSLAGAVVGAGLAWLSIGFLRASLPADTPRVTGIAINLRVLGVTSIVAVLAGLAFGMAPVAQFVRPSARSLIRGERSGTADRRSTWLRGALVVAEVALAAVLLVGAVMFLTSFARVTRVDLGFDFRDVLTVRLRPLVLPGGREPGSSPLLNVLDRVRSLPGVEFAALAGGGLPLRGDLLTEDFSIPGPAARRGDIAMNEVSPDYFRVLRIPVISGRAFTDADRRETQPVVILNQRAARQFFDGDPIGKVMRWQRQGERTVIGVVGNIRFDGPENQSRAQAFVPWVQSRVLGGTLLLRTASPSAGLLPGIGRVVASEFPDAVMPPINVDVQLMEQYFRDLVAERRVNMLLLSTFGILGIAIACAGIYGVMAYIVAQRTHEIGIRMALGALPAAIAWSVLVGTGRYVVLGLIAGLAGAWILSTTVRGLLFGIEPHEPAAYAWTGALLLAVALAAALIPARRAASVDPLVALRFE